MSGSVGADVIATLESLRTEVAELRSNARMPGVGADGKALSDTVIDIRQRVDRVEELLSYALQVRRAVRQTYRACEQLAVDAWDRALTRQRKAPVGINEDYTAAKERYALANLDTIDERTAMRAAEKLAADADTTVEVIRLHHRGLNDIRQDLLALLRNIQFETTLDR